MSAHTLFYTTVFILVFSSSQAAEKKAGMNLKAAGMNSAISSDELPEYAHSLLQLYIDCDKKIKQYESAVPCDKTCPIDKIRKIRGDALAGMDIIFKNPGKLSCEQFQHGITDRIKALQESFNELGAA